MIISVLYLNQNNLIILNFKIQHPFFFFKNNFYFVYFFAKKQKKMGKSKIRKGFRPLRRTPGSKINVFGTG
jgi:hypothetical protein